MYNNIILNEPVAPIAAALLFLDPAAWVEVPERNRRITNRRALRVIGRAMRYSLAYKYELAVKMTTQMTSTFWLAVLPFPAKIVIDYVVLPEGAKGETENAPSS